MDIHKPKAAHSWREFLTEIGTITCGILIALGLEQVVEAVHRDAEVGEAREALRAEVRENLDNLRYSLVENGCLQPQYAAYIAWAKGGPRPPPLRAITLTFYSSTWETVKSRTVPLMPLKERLALATFYDLGAGSKDVMGAVRVNLLTLQALYAHPSLSPADASRVLETATASERIRITQSGVLRYALARSVATGVAPPPKDQRELAAEHWVCTGEGVNPITGER